MADHPPAAAADAAGATVLDAPDAPPDTTEDHPAGDGTPSELAPAEDRGSLSVADRVVEKVASIAAQEVDAVIARASGWRKLAGRPLPRAKATVAGGRSRIGVEIATPWPTPLSSVAAQTRDHVRERVSTLTGVDVVAVDITVTGVHHLQPESRKLR